MLPDYEIYNLLKDFKLPIASDEKSLTSYVEKHLMKYKERLDQMLASTYDLDCEFYEGLLKNTSRTHGICNDIVNTLKFYDEGNIVEAYSLFFKMLDSNKNFILSRNEDIDNTQVRQQYYRIRSVEEKQDYDRKDLFHIPFSSREYITSYRYSIAGFPCLYLASRPELSWFECGMPKKFMMSEFRISDKYSKVSKLIDFSLEPIEFAQWLHLAYLNNHGEKKMLGHKILMNYLITYPIRMACSLVVKNKSVKFIHEYIVPQMTLLWVKKDTDFSGIAYQTCSNHESAQNMRAHNLVIPSRDITTGKYCDELCSKYILSTPEYLEVKSLISSNNDKLNEMREFLYKIQYIYEREIYFKEFRDMISICKSFMKICDNLQSENYIDGETLYQMIDTINLNCYLISNNKKRLIEKAINDKVLIIKHDKDELEEKLSNLLTEFDEKVKMNIFDFWGYDFKLMLEFTPNDLDFKQI